MSFAPASPDVRTPVAYPRRMPFDVRSRPLAAVLTLGCKLNLADSDEIAGALRLAGFDVVGHVCEADAFVVNTCSVTHVADKKSRRLVRSVRRLAPGAAVAVTGCFPQSAGFEAVQALGADFVGGTRDTDKAALVRFLAARGPASAAAPAPADGRRHRARSRAIRFGFTTRPMNHDTTEMMTAPQKADQKPSTAKWMLSNLPAIQAVSPSIAAFNTR